MPGCRRSASSTIMPQTASGVPPPDQDLNQPVRSLFGPAEYFFESDAEHIGDTEGCLQRRRIFALLDRRDRLAGDADPLAQLRLGHLAGVEAQGPDSVGEALVRHVRPFRAGRPKSRYRSELFRRE